ncbi:hypothetical protein V8C42DRAFT_327753 [Trichoderma barbatum]
MSQHMKEDALQYRQRIDYLSKHGGEARGIALYASLANGSEAIAQTLEPFEAPSSRVFGRVLYSPEFAVASDRAPWLRDWALLELCPESHQAPLRSLKNKAFIKSELNFLTLVKNIEEAWKGLKTTLATTNKKRLCATKEGSGLQKELYNTTETVGLDEPAAIVTKYGARGFHPRSG